MRWLFLILMIVNGSFFAGSWYEQSQEKYVLSAQSERRSERGVGITLLSEVSPSEIVSTSIEPLPADHQGSVLCVQIGAFRVRDTADQAEQLLLAYGISTKIRPLKVQSGEDFLVLMPALSDHNASLGRLEKLDAKGVDAFLVNEDEYAGDVSLGLFSEKALAVSLERRLSRRGYTVQINKIPRFRGEYWLEITLEDNELMSDELWRMLQGRYGCVEKHEKLCGSGIAPFGEFQ